MEKLRKILRLARVLLVIMVVFAAGSGWALAGTPRGDGLHTPLLVLFLVSIAIGAQLLFLTVYSTFYLHNQPKRATEADRADDLDREAREVRLAGLSVDEKNAALLREEEKQSASGAIFQVDQAASRDGCIVTHSAGRPAPSTPPHDLQPAERDLAAVFSQLELDSLAAVRTPGGAVLVELMAYNKGPYVVDGSLKAEVLDNKGQVLGQACLILPRNGIRIHQTVNLSGICIGPRANFPFDTVQCIPYRLYGYFS